MGISTGDLLSIIHNEGANGVSENRWTWISCIAFAERHGDADPRAFAAWAHSDPSHWLMHECVDEAYDRYITQVSA